VRRSHSVGILGAAALGCALLLPSAGRAQIIGYGDPYWASRPGVYTPFNGIPASQRYVDQMLFTWYDVGPNWHTLYLIDREERLEKFGTRYGPDHPPLFNRLLQRHR
jgi:hypothetical protein